METKLSLYIIGRNKSTLNYDILSIDNKSIICPSAEVRQDIPIQTQLFDILKQYTDIEDGIINYIFLDIKIKSDIDILYFCCIPRDLPIKNSYFLPIDNNKDHVINLQKIISII